MGTGDTVTEVTEEWGSTAIRTDTKQRPLMADLREFQGVVKGGILTCGWGL